LLIGTLAGGGLAVGYLLRPRSWPLPLAPRSTETAFDAWIKIAADGIVTVAVPQLEMGQGITTLIPQVVAAEMGADWRRIAVEPAPISPLYVNTVLAGRWAELWMPGAPWLVSDPASAITRRLAEDMSFVTTAEGTALAAYEAPLRAAAASVRAMLAKAAAARWGADWQECEATGGHVVLGKRRLAFGALAQEAAAYDPPSTPPLRPAPMRESPDAPPTPARPAYPRLDLPSKASGSHLFAGDIRLPDMVHAAIAHGPAGDSTLAGFDRKAAAGIQGLLTTVRHERWLAAVATNWWAAERGLDAMRPQFAVRDAADSTEIEAGLDAAIRTGEAARIHERGDPAGAFAERASLAMRYDVLPALHAALETATATARLQDGRLELWVAAQSPQAVRRDVARALAIGEKDVVLYPVPAGGSFDARLDCPHAVEAAIIARAVGRPVQLRYSRWQEHLAGLARPPVSALMSARLAADGTVTGWRARLALPPAAREFGNRLFGGMTPRAAMAAAAGQADAMAVAGALPPYAIGDVAVDHVPVRTGLPAGRMRGNAHGWTAFFTECFIDELAQKAGREPLSYRMAMLGHDLRLAECLQRCASLASWDAGLDASGQGLACHVMDGDDGGGARIAVIATARRDESGVRVDKLTAVADIGRIVNLDIARQQVEGGLVFGMGLALGSAVSHARGLPQWSRLGSLGLPLLSDCPRIEVAFVDSEAEPADPGELGVVAAAPAIANALHSATGVRFRRLPLLAEDV